MIPIGDNIAKSTRPVVTLTLVGLNLLLFAWDRNFVFFGNPVVFADLAMRPSEVVLAVTGQGDYAQVGKVFTSMFLHANVAHIIGNLLYLTMFGAAVEDALGGWRFALYYLFWGVVAAMAHIIIDPASSTPVLGASGAIGGVLGCYFLLFPSSRVTFWIPPFVFLPLTAFAFTLLGLWFLFQIFFSQPGVANWAHAGGFVAGMATVLILGGRGNLLFREGAPHYIEEVEDE